MLMRLSTVLADWDGPGDAIVWLVDSIFQVSGKLLRNQERVRSIRSFSSESRFAVIEKIKYTVEVSLFPGFC